MQRLVVKLSAQVQNTVPQVEALISVHLLVLSFKSLPTSVSGSHRLLQRNLQKVL